MSLIADSRNAAYVGANFPSTIRPGEQLNASVQFRNTGSTTWSPSGTNPVRLGTQNPRDRSSPFFTAGNWISADRPANVNTTVAPDGVGSFNFVLTGRKQLRQLHRKLPIGARRRSVVRSNCAVQHPSGSVGFGLR
jgi:hypothetical protein